jgi:hypothetical protein
MHVEPRQGKTLMITWPVSSSFAISLLMGDPVLAKPSQSAGRELVLQYSLYIK